MGKERANIGSLQEHGIIALLEEAYRDTWCGGLQLTTTDASGIIWFVRGQAVHAQCSIQGEILSGMAAFETLVCWNRGSFLLDRDTLPPARSIRLPMADLILAAKQSARRSLADETELYVPQSIRGRLDSIMDTLRKRVPGLESISVLNHDKLETSTASGDDEREWIGSQIKILSSTSAPRPETFFMKHQGRALLVIGSAEESTVLSASDDTTPEAMFWAGQEAQKRIKQADQETLKD